MRDVAIAGAGYSEIARAVDRSVGSLTLEACRNALSDAGLTSKDVDGIATYPGGHDSVSSFYVAEGLGLPKLNWFEDLFGWMPAGITPVIAAAEAVRAGHCETAIAFRTVKRNRTRPPGQGFGGRVGGDAQFRAPFGDVMTSQWLAMWARRHMHDFGTTEEHLGHIAITFREHASMNPVAPLRDNITIDDYFASKIITTPFRILDCDFPVDGGGAVVITTEERARDLPKSPVKYVAGVFASGPRPDWEQWDDLTHMASKYAAEALWRRTDITPQDVDVAEVYDGFSWTALCWMEDMGFCAKGDGGPFFARGDARVGGKLPTNTHGGSMSGGRLHAISHVIECVQQLRGECGARQVHGAKTGVVTAGGGIMAGAALLSRSE
ncbi:MAG: thiolase family protein [Actinomycetota bacterium]